MPSVQKKTGPVAKDIGDEVADSPKSETKRKRVTGVKKEEDVNDDEEEPKPKKRGSRSRKSEDAVEIKEESKPVGRRRSTRLKK